MSNREISVGTFTYEHTAALVHGEVEIEGVQAAFHTAPTVTEIFRGMVQGAYDVAELGLTYFLRTWEDGARFVGLPIFPNRNFRHSAIFVNTAAGIEGPADLAGRRIGEFALYGHDAGVWPKGILADEFGVRPQDCSWLIGGTNSPLPSLTWLPQPVPDDVEVRHLEDGQTLGAMLETGEIDALISVDVPQAVLDGSPRVRRLFPGYEAVERDYYRRTRIFPPMHLVAVRAELADDPDLLDAVYTAFGTAKDQVEQRYLAAAAKQHGNLMTPWFSHLFARNRELFGEDWWPYGVAANRRAVDTFLRYHHEQGLSSRRLTVDDIVAPPCAAPEPVDRGAGAGGAGARGGRGPPCGHGT